MNSVRQCLVCISQLSCLYAAGSYWGKTEFKPSFRFKLSIFLGMMRAKPHNYLKTAARYGDTSPFLWRWCFLGSALGRSVAENQNGLVLLVIGSEDFKKLSPSGGRVCDIRLNCSGDFSCRRLKKTYIENKSRRIKCKQPFSIFF